MRRTQAEESELLAQDVASAWIITLPNPRPARKSLEIMTHQKISPNQPAQEVVDPVAWASNTGQREGEH